MPLHLSFMSQLVVCNVGKMCNLKAFEANELSYQDDMHIAAEMLSEQLHIVAHTWL